MARVCSPGGVAWYVSEHTLSIHSVYRGRRELFYWAVVIAAFALGTAAGGLTAATLNLGYFPSISALRSLLCAARVGLWLLCFDVMAAFWWAYIVTRPLGASIADWLGKPYLGGLGFGDDKVSLVLLILLGVLPPSGAGGGASCFWLLLWWQVWLADQRSVVGFSDQWGRVPLAWG